MNDIMFSHFLACEFDILENSIFRTAHFKLELSIFLKMGGVRMTPAALTKLQRFIRIMARQTDFDKVINRVVLVNF